MPSVETKMIDRGHTGKTMCMALDNPEGLEWVCTRLILHDGPHQAGIQDQCVWEWENNGEMRQWPRETETE